MKFTKILYNTIFDLASNHRKRCTCVLAFFVERLCLQLDLVHVILDARGCCTRILYAKGVRNVRRPSEEAESILVVLTKMDTCLDSINNCFGGVYNGIAGLQKDVVDLSKELTSITKDESVLSEDVKNLQKEVSYLQRAFENDIRLNVRMITDGYKRVSEELLKSLRFEGERIQLLLKITELETKLKIMESDKKNTYTEYRRAAH